MTPEKQDKTLELIGQLNYEMICHAKNLAEAVFTSIKTPVSMLVNTGCQNNSGTCSLGHLREFSS